MSSELRLLTQGGTFCPVEPSGPQQEDSWFLLFIYFLFFVSDVLSMGLYFGIALSWLSWLQG